MYSLKDSPDQQHGVANLVELLKYGGFFRDTNGLNNLQTFKRFAKILNKPNGFTVDYFAEPISTFISNFSLSKLIYTVLNYKVHSILTNMKFFRQSTSDSLPFPAFSDHLPSWYRKSRSVGACSCAKGMANSWIENNVESTQQFKGINCFWSSSTRRTWDRVQSHTRQQCMELVRRYVRLYQNQLKLKNINLFHFRR